MNNLFDVIVVGAGHAGVEAAYVSARMGSKTALITIDLDSLAAMPCNPSLGGLGKGHIVYEVAAFGGLMPQLASQSYLQARMLNTSKGPAVQGLRLQIDKFAYSKVARAFLSKTDNLTLIKAKVQKIITEPLSSSSQAKKITGIITTDGLVFYARSVVMTTGTFMNGLIHIGNTRYKAGRRGADAVYGISQSIADEMGVELGRLKTGTPPRLLKSSIDYTKLERQSCEPLSYLFEYEPHSVIEKEPCYIAQTNEKTHEIISKNLHRSALYSGSIVGRGPRYCPSIEDKIGRYPDRPSHHVFIEPEGLGHHEVYPAGLSTSLPFDVQYAYIRSMRGFENCVITQCGYAIEYDFIQPYNLTHTLEAKTVKGLFLAGQPNGTTGYEEAAGQGLVAGINAHLCAESKEPFILSRYESYLGVMIDDLVTLGADEPYRMFTSRAERRLLLRQDTVFDRLYPKAHELRLISDEQCARHQEVMAYKEKALEYIKRKGSGSSIFKLFHTVDFTPDIQKEAYAALDTSLGGRPEAFGDRALLSLHAELRYVGYIEKEKNEVEKMEKYQQLVIPNGLTYHALPGLSKELQQKLHHYKPKTIAQAQLIPGITPAAITLLIFQISQINKKSNVYFSCELDSKLSLNGAL